MSRVPLLFVLLMTVTACGETAHDEPPPPYWFKRYGTTDVDRASLLGRLSNGELVLEGRSGTKLQLAGTTLPADEQFVARLDEHGRPLRARVTPETVWDVFPNGDLLTSGGGELDQPPRSVFIERQTAAGAVIWRWDPGWSPEGRVWTPKAHPDGSVILSGDLADGQGIMAKLGPDGSQQWLRPVDGYVLLSRALPDGGGVYLVDDPGATPPSLSQGTGSIIKLDENGDPSWEVMGVQADHWPDLVVAPNGTLYQTAPCEPWPGVSPGTVYQQKWEVCVDAVSPSGELLWQRHIGVPEFSVQPGASGHVAVSSTGRIVISTEVLVYTPNGPVFEPAGPLLVELDEAGNVLATRGPKAGEVAVISGVAVTDAGDIYLTGRFAFDLQFEQWELHALESTNKEDTDIFVAKIPGY